MCRRSRLCTRRLRRGRCDRRRWRARRLRRNYDIVGATIYGGLRYCQQAATFSTNKHYYQESDIMMVGQSCINDVKMFTDWDHSRLRDDPRTVKDSLGLRCADPDDEATCPKARRCMSEDDCHTDEPNWSDDEFLQRESPLGWGAETPKYLDPTIDHKWHILPPEYKWHMETTTWSITPREQSDFEALNLERPPPPPLMVLSG